MVQRIDIPWLAGHRPVRAGLLVVLYAAATIALPGLHLWHHADDHDHLGGGIHYRLNAGSAGHDGHDEDHDEDHEHHHAFDHDPAGPPDEVSLDQGSGARLNPIESHDSHHTLFGHAADSLAHFASSYLAQAPGLVAPLSLPACIPAPRSFYQAPPARRAFLDALGARAPPAALSA